MASHRPGMLVTSARTRWPLGPNIDVTRGAPAHEGATDTSLPPDDEVPGCSATGPAWRWFTSTHARILAAMVSGQHVLLVNRGLT